jgi:hypothetical protein
MHNGQGQISQIAPIEKAVAHTDSYSNLNTGQRRAVEEVLISRDRVQGLQGYAGVGKTTVLSAIRDAAEHNGYRRQRRRDKCPDSLTLILLGDISSNAGKLIGGCHEILSLIIRLRKDKR